MIALLTDNANLKPTGDPTYLSMLSGDGEPIVVALTRHPLGHLAHTSRKAILEAFDAPQPDLAGIKPMHRRKAAG